MAGNDPDADIVMAAAFGMDNLYLKTATSPEGPLPLAAPRVLLHEDYSGMESLPERP